jgi:beta-glucuronidase
MKKISVFILLVLLTGQIFAHEIPLLSNVFARQNITLNGKWNYVIDPLENGYYNYRMQPFTTNGFFENKKPANPQELVEYNLDTSPIMDIPSDWNTQNPQLFFYEGTVWLKKDFMFYKTAGTKAILYFGAVNYEAKVYVNGKKVGEHIGGYTPFNFDVTDVLVDGHNFVVLKVDNKRRKDGVPTVNMDWWNYGGITRDVVLSVVPQTYIQDYSLQYKSDNKGTIYGWIKLNEPIGNIPLTIEIAELKIKQEFKTDTDGFAKFEIKTKPQLWSPENPKLYDVIFSSKGEKFADKIGFRTIETKGKDILLNGKKIFLRGICIHEEAPFTQGRAWSREHAVTMLSWAKELGCNYVRLAHYPHNENMVREAERMGLLVWSEIPVYWTIAWENAGTYQNAERQLHDMIYRDKNRCAVIIWSIANETPHSDLRDKFLSSLSKYARKMDNTRLISMAMEVVTEGDNVQSLNDNMNEYVDILSFNQYLGWYWGSTEACRITKWNIPYNKPVVVSEFGGCALQGLHGPKTDIWNEEYQEELYIRTLEMLEKIDGFAGVSPWILVDFHSPRRQLSGVQDFFNRKGLISNNGIKKKAFFVLRDFYKKMEEQYK